MHGPSVDFRESGCSGQRRSSAHTAAYRAGASHPSQCKAPLPRPWNGPAALRSRLLLYVRWDRLSRDPDRRMRGTRALRAAWRAGADEVSPTGEGPLKAVAPARRPSSTQARMAIEPVLVCPEAVFLSAPL